MPMGGRRAAVRHEGPRSRLAGGDREAVDATSAGAQPGARRDRGSDGACLEVSTDDGPPRWLHEDGTDREFASGFVGVVRSSQECLELELRMFGEQTVGVWGALGEDDRRALVPHWRQATARPAASPGPRPQPAGSGSEGER